jgi:hypothetical protein
MEKRIWEVADSVHAADDAAVGHQPLALFTGVLAALIRVVQSPCPYGQKIKSARKPGSYLLPV